MPKHAKESGSYIRWVVRRDLPEILRIEHVSYDFPWCEDDFLRYLKQRSCIGLVCERGDDVIGFTIYELHKTEVHILNLAVHTDCRRQGVGRQIVEKFKSKLSMHRRNQLTINVRETNMGALLFFRAMAFRPTGVIRGFYEDTGEDGYFMRYTLPTLEVQYGAQIVQNRIKKYLST